MQDHHSGNDIQKRKHVAMEGRIAEVIDHTVIQAGMVRNH